MKRENSYVEYFYGKYGGRIALGVGYNQNFEEIFPFVFEKEGDSIGIVALGVITNGKTVVNIYHIGTFITKRGDGHHILKELCDYADSYEIILTVSAVHMPTGEKTEMNSDKLESWYKKYGFVGETGLTRTPFV